MLCLSTLAMIGLSWPLWVDGDDFPRVPFVPGLPRVAPRVSWILLGSIAAMLALAASGRAWRATMAAAVALLAVEVAGDQSRLQPWAYQFGVVGLALAATSGPRGLRLARWYAISLYLYSGLSKLDVSFVRELGATFLGAALGPVGVSPWGWPAPARSAAILAMPAWEVGVAIGLMFGPTRRPALGAAIVLHSALLAILGPWNLGHSPIVLVWNGAMIAQALILFGPAPEPVRPGDRDTRLGPAARLAMGIALVLPIFERAGLCDSWPAHALYASHAERADVFLHEDDLDRYPEPVRRRTAPEGPGPWRRLDLTGWSRDARGVPPYPQGRVGLGMAEFLAARYGGGPPVKVVLRGRADWRDGRRDRVECVGIRAIRREGDRSRINAHPSGVDRPDP